MKLYEMIDRVSAELRPENPEELKEYLKTTLVDAREYFKTKACKRDEALADREMGKATYISLGFKKPLTSDLKLFITGHKIPNLANFPVMMSWGDRKEYVEEDEAFFKSEGFKYTKIIWLEE